MLDRKFILDNAELVKKNCSDRGVVVDVDRFTTLESLRKEKQQHLEDLNRRANDISKQIGKSKSPDEKLKFVEEGRDVREMTTATKCELDEISDESDKIHRAIPNMAHPNAPIGADDQANLEFALGKTEIPKFDFEPKDHVEIAEKLDLIDFDGGARVAGSGFYFLKNEAVLLEIALQRYAVELLMKSGFTPMTTPDLARNEVLQGIGFNPRGNETQIYSVENSDLSLIATAEITLGGLLANKTVDAEELPLRFCGISHCFRTEAGAAGRASRGIYRVHQFTKIEMFAFTLPEQSDAMHQELLQIECQVFDGLGIPYRIVDTATGDLGAPAYRKYDLEGWMPGRNAYGEVTSTSNCTDYQARRLNARYKAKGEKGTRFLHTLNGTAIAISRALVAILELYQQADGSVKIPSALQKYVGFDKISR
ncbi:MAG: serine--tRNA ligase [Planctomycetaceae bacterium]|nr:serine--tRNA ligase [Planctomycetaceae bacterium]